MSPCKEINRSGIFASKYPSIFELFGLWRRPAETKLSQELLYFRLNKLLNHVGIPVLVYGDHNAFISKMIPARETAHHTLTCSLWRDHSWTGCGLLALQYQKFCLFTRPKRWKCASSLKKAISSGGRFSRMFSRAPKQLCLSCSELFWSSTILYRWKWRSMCKIRQTLQTNIWRAAACLRAKRYRDCKI